MNAVQFYETMDNVKRFTQSLRFSDTDRQNRVQKAIDVLDEEVKLWREEEFVNEVLNIARSQFGDDIRDSEVFEIIADIGGQRLKKLSSKRIVKREPVKQFSLDGKFVATYKSVSAAAEAVNVTASAIVCALKGRSHSSAGFIWRYADDDAPVVPRIIKTSPYPRAVGQYTNGNLVKCFVSIRSAAKQLCISEMTVRRVLDQDREIHGYQLKSLER